MEESAKIVYFIKESSDSDKEANVVEFANEGLHNKENGISHDVQLMPCLAFDDEDNFSDCRRKHPSRTFSFSSISLAVERDRHLYNLIADEDWHT